MIEPIEEQPGANAFEFVASGVYRRVDSGVIWKALQYAISQELITKNPTIMILFIRIAEVYPGIREDLESRRSNVDARVRAAIELILSPPSELSNASYLPEAIQSPGEMDLCWAEFLVTGQSDTILKVVSVLDREDLTRAFVEEQLADSNAASLTLNDAERTELAQSGITLGLEADDGPDIILSDGDVDILLWFSIKAGCEASAKILRAMPDAVQLHVATKGAAIWSLQANARQHGSIRLLCEKEADRPGGFGRQLIRP